MAGRLWEPVDDWWRYSISVVGAVMLAGGVGSLLLDGQLGGDELRQGAGLVVACLLLIGAGARIAIVVRDWNQMALILGWMSTGVLAVGLLGAWGAVVLPTVETAFETALVFLSVLAVGALFGSVVGYYNVRVRRLARRAGRERARREYLDEQQETFSSLHGILRHQILNDLTAISGQAQLLEAERVEPADATEPILDHCDHMERTVERIDTLFGILTHAPDLEPRDIREAVRRGADRTREAHPAFRVEVDGGDDRQVLADDLLSLAFAELFDNTAVHGDGAATVTVSETGDTVTVEVSDDGPGIGIGEPELFEPNTRGPDSDGDGLGLYFASLIVDRYDGRISLDDAADGATLRIAIPAAK